MHFSTAHLLVPHSHSLSHTYPLSSPLSPPLYTHRYILWSNIPGCALGLWCSHSIVGILCGQIAVRDATEEGSGKAKTGTTDAASSSSRSSSSAPRSGSNSSGGGLGMAENESLVALDSYGQKQAEAEALAGAAAATVANAAALSSSSSIDKGQVSASPGDGLAPASLPTIDSLRSKVLFMETAMWMAPMLWGIFAQLAWISYKDTDTALDIVGNACITQTVIYFGAPLSQVLQVILLKDSSSIYPPMVITNAAACVMWAVYGLQATDDVTIWGPNVAGIILQIVNMFLCLWYKNSHWRTIATALGCCAATGNSDSSAAKDKDNKL